MFHMVEKGPIQQKVRKEGRYYHFGRVRGFGITGIFRMGIFHLSVSKFDGAIENLPLATIEPCL